MPIDIYKCEKCRDFIEKFYSADCRPEEIECPVCGGVMKNITAPTGSTKETK